MKPKTKVRIKAALCTAMIVAICVGCWGSLDYIESDSIKRFVAVLPGIMLVIFLIYKMLETLFTNDKD